MWPRSTWTPGPAMFSWTLTREPPVSVCGMAASHAAASNGCPAPQRPAPNSPPPQTPSFRLPRPQPPWLLRSDVSVLHADGMGGELLAQIMQSQAGVRLIPLTVTAEPPAKGMRLLVDGHEVVGLPADHPARRRYEQTMGMRAGGTGEGAAGDVTDFFPGAGGSEAAAAAAAAATAAAAAAANDAQAASHHRAEASPDDPMILHSPAAVGAVVAAAPARHDPRLLVIPSRPLQMGQCGAPLVDAFDQVVGMVESTLTAAHGKLAGAGVCVTGARIEGLLSAVARRMTEHAALATSADGQRPAAARTSSWGKAGMGSPHGERPSAGTAPPVALDWAELDEAQEAHGEDAARSLAGPAGVGSAGTTFGQLATDLFSRLTRDAGHASQLAAAAAEAGGYGRAETEAAAADAAWLVLAGMENDAGSAAEAAVRGAGNVHSASERGANPPAASSPAGQWGLSAEHTSRLAAVLGADKRPQPGSSVARELAHSAALAAHIADDALAADGDALPLAHRLALQARQEGSLARWVFSPPPPGPDGAWESLGMDPPRDGGRITVAAGTPGAGRSAARGAALAELEAASPKAPVGGGQQGAGAGAAAGVPTPAGAPRPTSMPQGRGVPPRDIEEAPKAPAAPKRRRERQGLKLRYSRAPGSQPADERA